MKILSCHSQNLIKRKCSNFNACYLRFYQGHCCANCIQRALEKRVLVVLEASLEFRQLFLGRNLPTKKWCCYVW